MALNILLVIATSQQVVDHMHMILTGGDQTEGSMNLSVAHMVAINGMFINNTVKCIAAMVTLNQLFSHAKSSLELLVAVAQRHSTADLIAMDQRGGKKPGLKKFS